MQLIVYEIYWAWQEDFLNRLYLFDVEYMKMVHPFNFECFVQLYKMKAPFEEIVGYYVIIEYDKHGYLLLFKL